MSDQAKTKSCLVCDNEISIRAKKCTHCDAYQDWRRFTDFVPSFLPWIAVIVTTCVALLPILQKMFHNPDSQLEMFEPVPNLSNQQGVKLIVFNRGDRPAVIFALSIKIPSGVTYGPSNSLQGSVGIAYSLPITVIDPGSRVIDIPVAKDVDASLMEDVFKRYENKLMQAVKAGQIAAVTNLSEYMVGCTVSLGIIDFNKGQSELSRPLDCHTAGLLVLALEGKEPP